jgi:hypothetical protein
MTRWATVEVVGDTSVTILLRITGLSISATIALADCLAAAHERMLESRKAALATTTEGATR